MRTVSDRIRHTVSFELIGILLATPLTTLFFHLPAENSAVVVIGSATVAMAWNYIYNLGFDHLNRWRRGTTEKSLVLRIMHAILFEAGLLIIGLPVIAWYLGITLWEALVMDIALALFYMSYAFVFNWGYDRLFPLPEWKEKMQ